MSDSWRSAAARDLAKRIHAAGGNVERVGVGRLRVAGPLGTCVIHEPAGETRRDLRRSAPGKLVESRTGLRL